MSDISKVKVKKPLEVILLQVIISGNNSNEPTMSTEQDNLLIVLFIDIYKVRKNIHCLNNKSLYFRFSSVPFASRIALFLATRSSISGTASGATSSII